MNIIEKIELQKIKRHQSLSELVYEKLRVLIAKGEIPSDTKLFVKNIATKFGVSYTPVREAILKLYSNGYVELSPNKVAVVKKISPREVIEYLQTRQAIEGYAVKLLAIKNNEQEILEIEEIMKNLEKKKNERDMIEYGKASEVFHIYIVSHCGNEKLFEIYKDIFEKTRKFRLRALKGSDRFEKSFLEHRLIIDAIKENNPNRASALMEDHIGEVINILIKESKNY